MEEPGRLQSMGSLRVEHDWVTSLPLFTFMHWRRKWQPTPGFLPGESQGQGSLVGCCLWGHRVGHDWSDLAVAVHRIIPTLSDPEGATSCSMEREAGVSFCAHVLCQDLCRPWAQARKPGKEIPRKLTVSFLLSILASFLNLSATTYFPKSSSRSSVHLLLGFCLPSVGEIR